LVHWQVFTGNDAQASILTVFHSGLMQEMSTFRDNAHNADATSTPDICKYDDDESVSLSDIDSDIDHVDGVVC
jgi:hypothetical protein